MPSEYFRAGAMKIMIAEPKKIHWGPRPLVLLIPPVFNDGFSGVNRAAVDQLTRRGYRVAVIPNPTSPLWVSRGPNYERGDLIMESKAILELFAGIRYYIQDKNILNTQIVGRSYGGFIAAVVKAMDANSARPMLGDQITLIGPSIHRQKSMDKFDRELDEQYQKYLECCSTRFKQLRILLNLLGANNDSELTPATHQAMGPMFAYMGFQSSLIELAEELDRTESLGVVPTDSEANKKWRLGFRFAHLNSQFVSPQVLKRKPADWDNLSYWLKVISQRQNMKLRVISAVDDFLSDPQDWQDTTHFTYNSQNLLLLSWGGHLGYEVFPEYQNLLDIMFPRQP